MDLTSRVLLQRARHGYPSRVYLTQPIILIYARRDTATFLAGASDPASGVDYLDMMWKMNTKTEEFCFKVIMGSLFVSLPLSYLGNTPSTGRVCLLTHFVASSHFSASPHTGLYVQSRSHLLDCSAYMQRPSGLVCQGAYCQWFGARCGLMALDGSSEGRPVG
jgi:hypothetical protein